MQIILGKLKDIADQKFGRLTAIERIEISKSKGSLWLCQCDCGNCRMVYISSLLNGTTRSCGCIKRDMLINRNTKHGYAKKNKRLYQIYKDMHARCYDKNCVNFANYGMRGILVCDAWHDIENFMTWALSSGYKDDLTIDRIDVYGNYEPSNCRWLTCKEQQNNKRTTIFVEFNGEIRKLSEWCKLYQLDERIIRNRYCLGKRGDDLFKKINHHIKKEEKCNE